MIAYARRNVAILTSVGAMVVSVLLIIFFGAWAVSASGESGVQSLLSGATSGFSGSVSPQSVQSGRSASAADPDSAPRLATAAASGGGVTETWWGKAFLVACPLH